MDIFLKSASALNDETRIKILKFINIYGKCCVCDLENSFEILNVREDGLIIVFDFHWMSLEHLV